MTEAYLIENGEITEPLREGNLHRQRPAGAARHRPARQRLRHGQPRHVRQGRPGRAGRRRSADAAGQGADDRRHRSMTAEPTSCSDRRSGGGDGQAGRAHRGVRVARQPRPTIRDLRGRGRALRRRPERGHRHPRDPRRPYRVRLRRHARRGGGRRGPGRGARQRRSSARPTNGPRSPSPTASTSIAQDLWSEALADVLDRRARSSWPRSSSGWRSPSTRGCASTTPTTPMRPASRPWRRRPASAAAAGRTAATSSVSTLADDGDETQTGFGFSVGRSPVGLRSGQGRQRSQPIGPPACSVPRSRRRAGSPSCSIPTSRPASSASSAARSTARASPRGAACSRTASARHVASPIVTLVDDPTNPQAYTATDIDGEGLAARRNVADRRRRAARLRALSVLGPAGRRRSARATRSAVASRAPRASVAWRCSSLPATRDQAALIADVDDGVLVQSVRGCTAASTRSAATSRPVRPAC